ncbi:unnamed protein product, partial [Rotaria sp. Silwood2]
LIDTVADCMAFRALEDYPERGIFLIFNYTCYRCTSDVTEWTKCSYSTRTATRKRFDIPDDIKSEYDALEIFSILLRSKVLEEQATIAKTLGVPRVIQEPTYDPNLPLSGYVVSSADRGTFSSKIDETVGIVISSQDKIQKLSKTLQEAQTLNIYVVSEDFLNEIQKGRPSIIMEKCKISSWGILPHIRQQTKTDEEAKIKSGRQSFTILSGKSNSKFFFIK